ncbi:MAG: 8-amino-7-oxononanoate synthase [Muribaculaceae bacterium]|nr:8-amino-7-oxononanoate synthase [Muribaculaceae bacterium]
MDINATLQQLEFEGNLRRIPESSHAADTLDLSGNDYLGIAERSDMRREFMEEAARHDYVFSASASRLLASRQSEFREFEDCLTKAYGRPALLFNSGYHANTGMIAALASDRRTLVVADKLVHASIIDGIRLSGAPLERFRHNDYTHLRRILDRKARDFSNVLIIAESLYSMDGDRADIAALADAKASVAGAMLYIDEAHAVGACGPAGLGLVEESGLATHVDIVVGTLGKALAGTGAYGIMNTQVRDFMINKARSFIFSTAIPPICAAWNRFVFERMQGMDSERRHLAALSRELYSILGLKGEPSHIAPWILGSPQRAVFVSDYLERHGFHALPIRTPTVPPGTDRVRFSLSAAMSIEALNPLRTIIAK